jgi:Collagen triple helix repeat (20 copies)
MLTPTRRRLNYANVTATVALVLSMTGGALAASHYVINSTKQINPRVLKQLKGAAGAVGVQGTTGPGGKEGADGQEGPAGRQGPAGKEGPQGKEGPAGKEGAQGSAGPLPVTLASGRTLKGTFGGSGAVVTDSNNAVELSISYPFPLAASPAAEVVPAGGSPTASCPGSAAAPSAAAGHLCVYVGGGHEVDTTNVSTYGDDGSRDYRYGAVVYAYPTCKAPCRGEFWGTWAITAP